MNQRTDQYGTKRWYNEKGKLHRLIEPTVVFENGDEFWHRDGKWHRLDGPAELCWGNVKYWAWLGKRCTEKQHSVLSNTRFFTRRVKI